MLQCVSVLLVLAAAVLQAASQAPTPVSCTSPSSTACGTALSITSPLLPGITLHVYNFSAQEKAGTCSRPGLVYPSNTTCMQNTTLGECTCKDAACEACTQNKTLADVQSCCGFYTYVYNGVSYYYINDALKKPTCCTALGTDPTGKAAKACYCQPSTEGCFKVCPAVPTSRIIGGSPVSACHSGVIRIMNGGTVICNGVYAYHPTGTDSTGAKLLKPVVIVPKTCTDGIDIITANVLLADLIQVTIGNTTFPYKPDEVTRKPLAATYLEALTFKNADPCLDKPMCTYNKATMASLINKKDCSVQSFGADGVDPNGAPIASGNLNALPVYAVGTVAACISGSNTTAECFFPVNLAAFACMGDLGAPVMCSLTTGEKVLYGVFGQTTQCGPTSKLFPVVPVS